MHERVRPFAGVICPASGKLIFLPAFIPRLVAASLGLAAVLAGSASLLAGEFVVSTPGDVHDAALLDGDFAAWNFGGSPLLEAGFMGGIYAQHHAVTLLRFDLSGVPLKEITSARIRLYKPRSFIQTAPVTLSMYEVAVPNAGWLEGGASGADDPGGASWTRPKVNQKWAGAPGCSRPDSDFVAKPLATQTALLDQGEWLEFQIPPKLAQRWLDNPSENAGVYVTAGVSSAEWGQHVYFYSSEHYSGKGPQLVLTGEAGPAHRPAEDVARAKTPMILPPMGPAFDSWLKEDGRIAHMTLDCRMTREQARVFYYFDTQVRDELILPHYQRPLGQIFTRMSEQLAQDDAAGVRTRLEQARKALLAWEYIRETTWYTAGANADFLSPWQLGQLFGHCIFGRKEEHDDESGREKLRDAGRDANSWEGTWQPLAGKKLEDAVEKTLQTTAQRLSLTPEQKQEIAGPLVAARREENRYLTGFRQSLDKSRDLARQNIDDAKMLAAVRAVHLNHERYLYYQSIYDEPRWNLFMEKAPVLSFGKWVAEVGKRYYPKPRSSKTLKTAAKVRRKTDDILPKAALARATGHPLKATIQDFLTNQAAFTPFQDTRLTADDYLRIINSQVAFFRRCQNDAGVIIDPVAKIEWQYSTPCYALSVALLHASGYNVDPGLFESGVRAMDASVNEIHEYRCAHNHGEFFIQPVMLALDLFVPHVPKKQLEDWRGKLGELDPYKLYPDNLQRKKLAYNHNLAALAGEALRARQGWSIDTNFFETHLEHQKRYISPLGMYKDQDPNVPMVYDEFSRQFLAAILCEGYRGPSQDFYRDAMWKGAWTSLFMQSPFGECPAGGRSAHHIWNEAQMAVTYEIYAAQYARHHDSPDALARAGAFKRAAHLSLQSIERWLRPDGSGYIVKNRYPIEAKHGYERYSAQSQYNLLACWLMAVAYVYSDESIPERPAPADTGGFVLPMVADFHKIFANTRGNYVEYETAANLHYNPTGLLRVHLRGSNPQLGPSDGVVHEFDVRTKADLGGENLAVGPSWRDASGSWHRLADYAPTNAPTVEVLREGRDEVSFRVTYAGDFDGVKRLREIVTVTPAGVKVRDELTGPEHFRICYPMLVFDGLEETRVKVAGGEALLSLRDGSVRFAVAQPDGAVLQRSSKRLDFRSGQAELLYSDIPGSSATYLIQAAGVSSAGARIPILNKPAGDAGLTHGNN